MKSAKILQKLILIALLFLCIPGTTNAADQSNLGKIIINVRDENNNPYFGNWFLYHGSSNSGTMARNGSSGETFSSEAGTYFIEAQKRESLHPYRLIRSENPQTLLAGGTITFDIQYFKTEDQKNSPQIPTVTTETTTVQEPATPVLITPAPVAPNTEENTITPAPVDNNSENNTSDQDPNGRTYMGPETIPTTISAPTTEPAPAAEADLAKPKELAKTGSPVLLLFAFSGLLGGIVTRKKK